MLDFRSVVSDMNNKPYEMKRSSVRIGLIKHGDNIFLSSILQKKRFIFSEEDFYKHDIQLVGWFVFYVISTLVGYLMPNLACIGFLNK